MAALQQRLSESCYRQPKLEGSPVVCSNDAFLEHEARIGLIFGGLHHDERIPYPSIKVVSLHGPVDQFSVGGLGSHAKKSGLDFCHRRRVSVRIHALKRMLDKAVQWKNTEDRLRCLQQTGSSKLYHGAAARIDRIVSVD